ncbi:MAG: hypothetical protein PHC62_10410 [Candidatus Izemoplasmatales bacterium]|nr:hypothetical protein [Candidatus Izemoplasmatales bacterium]
MKTKISTFIDWFEKHFNFIIDIIALIGGTFMILFSLAIFISLLTNSDTLVNVFEIIVLPGAIGFMGIAILFALRITRHITKK